MHRHRSGMLNGKTGVRHWLQPFPSGTYTEESWCGDCLTSSYSASVRLLNGEMVPGQGLRAGAHTKIPRNLQDLSICLWAHIQLQRLGEAVGRRDRSWAGATHRRLPVRCCCRRLLLSCGWLRPGSRGPVAVTAPCLQLWTTLRFEKCTIAPC